MSPCCSIISNRPSARTRRFPSTGGLHEIRTAPLLILDGFKESNMNSAWAKTKLYQILNYRYYDNLPTVITSHAGPKVSPGATPA